MALKAKAKNSEESLTERFLGIHPETQDLTKQYHHCILSIVIKKYITDHLSASLKRYNRGPEAVGAPSRPR